MTAEELRALTATARHNNLRELIKKLLKLRSTEAEKGFSSVVAKITADDFKRIIGKMDVPTALKLVNDVIFPEMGAGVECMIEQKNAEHFTVKLSWEAK